VHTGGTSVRHAVFGELHVELQPPLWHSSSGAHIVVHVPQWFVSFCSLTQLPLQLLSPALQQMPLTLTLPVGQHRPLSLCWPVGQHRPLEHEVPVPQTAPVPPVPEQPPQLLSSLFGSLHAPLHRLSPFVQQCPIRHDVPVAHVFPHPPQFVLLFASTHVPPQFS
jgi:hypothetical protein